MGRRKSENPGTSASGHGSSTKGQPQPQPQPLPLPQAEATPLGTPHGGANGELEFLVTAGTTAAAAASLVSDKVRTIRG